MEAFACRRQDCIGILFLHHAALNATIKNTRYKIEPGQQMLVPAIK